MTDPSTYPVVQPQHSQEWLDGHSPGYSWLVGDIEHGVVTLLLLHDGEATEGVIQWPVNRWPALIDKQALVLKEES